MSGFTRPDLADALEGLVGTAEEWDAWRGAFGSWDVSELIGDLSAPTLVVGVDGIRWSPATTAQRIATEVPEARLVVFQHRAPHMFWGSPERDQLIAYIERHVLDPGAPDPGRTFREVTGTGELADQATSGRAAEPAKHLSPRELEVLRLLATGLTNSQIADRLSIQPSTVSRHVHNLLTKTDCANRTELTAYAHQTGLV